MPSSRAQLPEHDVPSEASASPQPGIDIRQALDILSSRSCHSHGHSHHSDSSCDVNIPKEATSMGQTIDLNQVTKFSEEQSLEDVQEIADSLEDKRKELNETRETRESEIRAKLETMTVQELLHEVMTAQEGRVICYRNYDQGLETVMKTGNINNYPLICAKATASFAVLSHTIKVISHILAKTHYRKDLSGFLTTLQEYECEKLNVTAALHLEQLRAHDEANIQANGDHRITALLHEGISSMNQAVNTCIEKINEVLDELRLVIADDFMG